MSSLITAIQPYFVLNTTAYYKHCMYRMGISHFYEFVCDCVQATDTIVVPDGAIDVIFCCERESPDAVAYGSVMSAQNQLFEAGRRYFGARFLPGTVLYFSTVSSGEILASAVSLTELPELRTAVEEIAGAPDFEHRIGIFIQKVMPKVGLNLAFEDGSAALTGRILAEIGISHGQLTLKDLEEDLYYSERHLNRVFQANTGFTIKKFCRYVRFQTLLQMLQDRDATILEASEEAGYYDQNHLQKEFHEFAHSTPRTFRELMKKENYTERIIRK